MRASIRRILFRWLLPLVAASAAAADRLPLKVGLYENPPKVFTDAAGQPAGILVDVLRKIADEEGWSLTFVPCIWEACLPALADGRIDLMPDVAYTDERAQRFAFHTVPALHSWSQIYRRPDTAVRSVPDLRGKRIAVLRGSAQEQMLVSLLAGYGVQATLVPASSLDAAFSLAARRQADVAIGNNYFGDLESARYGLEDTPIVFQPVRLYYAAAKGKQAEALAAIDRKLAVWQADPDSVYYGILRDWRPQPPLRSVPSTLWWGLAAIGGLLLSALGTAAALRRKVAAQTRDLQQSEQKLSTILDSVGSLIYIKDAAYRYTYVNRAMTNLLGKPAADILGKVDAQLFDRATADALHARDLRVIEAGERVVAEEYKEDLGQSGPNRRTFLSTKIPLASADGTVYALCGISTDITERKRMEESLRVAAAVFHSQEGMVVIGPDLRVLDANEAFSRLTGFSVADLLGQPIPIVTRDADGADYRPAMWAEVQQHGKWQGEVWARRKDGEQFPAWLTLSAVRNAEGAITHYVSSQTDITQRHLAQEQITRLAYYDPLTGLPNRRLLIDRLHQCLSRHRRETQAAALLFIDLDNFKDLNDTRGHEAGDELLQQVAQRILGCCRESDTVARLGGDEFVVLIENAGPADAAATTHTSTVAHKILDAVDRPYLVTGMVHHCTCSIGAAVCLAPNVGIDDLMKRGDLAMYQAKRDGRNTVRFFHEGMESAATLRAALESELRDALERNQFQLHYQAQFDIAGRIVGAEALVRWRHTYRGVVPPAEFIGVAEASGLIVPLGHWVLAAACQQLVVWSRSTQLAGIRLAVNVSARQFRQPDFVDRTLALVEETGINPALLKLELTESMLIDDVGDTIAKMQRLKRSGVGFALDDFGTGYSSLSYLKQLPLDQLKIDRSFVRDVLTDANDAAIATSIVAMGKALGLDLIAEGVEGPEQRDFLARLGCHSFQGYLYGQPADGEAFCRGLHANGTAMA